MSEENTCSVPVPITDEMRIECGNRLAQDQIELDALINENKSLNAGFRKNRDEIKFRMSADAVGMQDGVTFKDRKIQVEYDTPEDGLKSYFFVPEEEDNLDEEKVFWKELDMTIEEKDMLL